MGSDNAVTSTGSSSSVAGRLARYWILLAAERGNITLQEHQGGGVFDIEKTRRSQTDFIPEQAKWIK